METMFLNFNWNLFVDSILIEYKKEFHLLYDFKFYDKTF